MEMHVRTPSSASESNSARSPLANFPFFKNLTGEKKVTRDGQPPKRRGPKPDSKPALTRRQELNRQAQRTHRERKEAYIKALEQEVLRLKEIYATSTKERDAIAEENRRLKELLAQHGIAFDMNSPPLSSVPSNAGGGFVRGHSYGHSSSGSISGSYGPGSASTGFTSPPGSLGPPSVHTPQMTMPGSGPQGQQPHPQQQNQLDYDQIGIDFVLTLERPCMDHMQMLMVRSADSEADDVSGHALMATCPPGSHIAERPDEPYPHQMPDGLAMPDLLRLLDLSNRLPLDGEITPVMAWAQVLAHPRFAELTREDFATMRDDLGSKVRCYGFGAVLEEFEVRDTLSSVLATKPDSYHNARYGYDVEQ
ncbi:hypothetical protein BDY21DRAFT_384491 [Lineolata rhizophorae]|uniref:BZIP domain-containing protein n=1 Tax=Lineolata rhizophorae TaxID=578093 RepID=A0A6A6P8B7_9PEZI|nr:hypothetical protein BDY21DRAFT_384491 [Lineolata rhizophorae]